MKNFILSLLVCIVVAACNHHEKDSSAGKDKTPAADPHLISDSAWGQISNTTTFEDLNKIYGNSNVKDERICGPECVDSIDVTKIYPSSANEAVIYWADSLYHKKIGMIECYGDSAAWHTASGIKIGSGMPDLLKLNGQKISFSGFGWDYGGTIISYNGGNLDKSAVHFDIDAREQVSDSLYGDTELNTDMPAVKKDINKIIVRSIRLTF